ncbi:TPA: DUF4145 domain-containing protein [Aeromonas veronii]|nr:DUF4145 domain-containing protein [Aeromonas veronii]
MKSQHYPPAFKEKKFHCPLCHVYSVQHWAMLKISAEYLLYETDFHSSLCEHCNERSYWHAGRLIIPNASMAQPMHHDLPEDCRADYEEAREIVGSSPRGAAALLRLCLQKLMPHLGETGKNINDDIRSLVGKGLPAMTQQALDVCRVVGNNAVHPGELDIKDTPEIAHQLFKMINFIVEERITRPKEVQALFDQLPKGAVEAIAKRDAAK